MHFSAKSNQPVSHNIRYTKPSYLHITVWLFSYLWCIVGGSFFPFSRTWRLRMEIFQLWSIHIYVNVMHLPCKYAFKIMLISSKANNITGFTTCSIFTTTMRYYDMIILPFCIQLFLSVFYDMNIRINKKLYTGFSRSEMDTTRKGKHGDVTIYYIL